MPAISYSDIASAINPAPAWRFYCTLPNIAGSSLQGQILSFYVKRCNIPHPTINFEPVPFNAGERFLPVGRSLENITMTLMEDTNYSVIQYLYAWRKLVIDDNGNFGLPSTYKLPISLQPYDETGNSSFTFTYAYCSPSHVDGYEYDGSATHYVEPNITFVIDVPPGSGTAGVTVSGPNANQSQVGAGNNGNFNGNGGSLGTGTGGSGAGPKPQVTITTQFDANGNAI